MKAQITEVRERIRLNRTNAPPGRPIDVAAGCTALAAFERTLEPAITPFDRWVAGDETAISAAAKRGFALFNGKAACVACHNG